MAHPASPRLTIVVSLLALCCVGGCSILRGGKLLAPESFGLIPIAPNLYVEAAADEATQVTLRDALRTAESAIHETYGSVRSRPIVHACISQTCYEKFGGGNSIAKIFGDRILLSPRGLNWHFLAHEWSHAEMSSRLNLSAWLEMPQWFDEGVAVVTSEAPEHSESHWQYLIASDIPRPMSEELRSLKSLKKWLQAVRRYGEDKNIERKAKGEPTVSPVYSAAGHELRAWLAKTGNQGLAELLKRLNSGQEFEAAYQSMSNR